MSSLRDLFWRFLRKFIPLIEPPSEEEAEKNPFTPSAQTRYELRGIFQLFFLVPTFILFFSILGDTFFEHVDSMALAQNVKATNIFFRPLPLWLLNIFTYLFNGRNARYMIAPFTAIVIIILSGASYVQDIYLLENFKDAFHYVTSSLFSLLKPNLRIDDGEKKIKEGEVNLLDKIGGPGHVLIQPGHAVMFRHLREPSKISMSNSYFMIPFETVGQIANLDEQHGHLEDLKTITKDGIQVTVRDIHFRFRILEDEYERSKSDPYPYSEESFKKMVYNTTVTKDGSQAWSTKVQKKIIGSIKTYVNSHDIDYLTAPKKEGQDPRGNLRYELFAQGLKKGLKGAGAELLWVDIGHIDIIEGAVDESRINLWAEDWISNAEAIRAFGEATRQAYQELGRAEAQAELIMGIAHSLEDIPQNEDSVDNLRKAFLVRTAQVLDAMSRRDQDEK